MAIGSTIGAIAGGVASAGASALLGGAFGGGGSSSQPVQAPVRRVRSNQLNIKREGQNRFFVERRPEAQRLMNNLQGAGDTASGRFSDLLSRVRPGFSDIRAAREDSIRNTFLRERSQAVGTLRQNLSRRGVLGSSFADASLGQAESAFADAEARALAEAGAQSLLEEIDLTQQLATQDFNITSSVIQGMLDQGRFETTAGINLANGTQMAMAESARLQQELAIANAQGAGAFFQPAIDAVGEGVGDLVGGLFK